jgi:hypothetical protein
MIHNQFIQIQHSFIHHPSIHPSFIHHSSIINRPSIKLSAIIPLSVIIIHLSYIRHPSSIHHPSIIHPPFIKHSFIIHLSYIIHTYLIHHPYIYLTSIIDSTLIHLHDDRDQSILYKLSRQFTNKFYYFKAGIPFKWHLETLNIITRLVAFQTQKLRCSSWIMVEGQMAGINLFCSNFHYSLPVSYATLKIKKYGVTSSEWNCLLWSMTVPWAELASTLLIRRKNNFCLVPK